MAVSPYEGSSSRLQLPVSTLLILGVGALLVFQFQTKQWPFESNCSPPRPVIDNQPDDNDQTIGDELSGSYLVVVEESKNRSVERLKILNDYEFWFSLKDRGLGGFRVIDPDAQSSQSFIEAAAKRSISHPFIMHVASNGKVLDVVKFPKTTSEIEAILK